MLIAESVTMQLATIGKQSAISRLVYNQTRSRKRSCFFVFTLLRCFLYLLMGDDAADWIQESKRKFRLFSPLPDFFSFLGAMNTTTHKKSPAELISTIEGNAPSGCYHIKILLGSVRTRINNSGTLLVANRAIAHLTLLEGGWNGLSLEAGDANEYVGTEALYGAITRHGIRRVDYLCWI